MILYSDDVTLSFWKGDSFEVACHDPSYFDSTQYYQAWLVRGAQKLEELVIGYPAPVASLGIIEVMRRAGLFRKRPDLYARGPSFKGRPEVPMTAEELKAKFTDCARQTLSENATQRVLDDLNQLETLKDIRPLCQLLMGWAAICLTFNPTQEKNQTP
jgi:hypothetical protein